MSKVSCFLLLLLVLTNLFWVYQTIDQGITTTYREVTHEDTSKALNELSSLCEPLFIGKSAIEVRSLAEGIIDQSSIFEKTQGGDSGEDLLVLGSLVFVLDTDGNVVSIE